MAKILLVEDNPKNRRLMEMLLKSARHEVTSVEDGEAALEAVKADRYALAIMDLQLPKIDGFEVTRRIKGDPELQGLPVLAVSAYAMPGDREKAQAAGVDAYMSKPIDNRELLRTVAGLVDEQP